MNTANKFGAKNFKPFSYVFLSFVKLNFIKIFAVSKVHYSRIAGIEPTRVILKTTVLLWRYVNVTLMSTADAAIAGGQSRAMCL